MSTGIKVWIIILSAFTIFNLWGLGNAYERIIGNTQVISQYAQIDEHNAQVIEQMQGVIDEQSDAINSQRDCIIELQDLWNTNIAEE